MLLIQNACVHTMDRQPDGSFLTYEKGYVLLDGKKIVAVGEGAYLGELAKDARIVDARGGHVAPGFVDGHCHLGLDNEGLRWEGMDYNEIGNAVTPGVRAIDSIFPQDKAFFQAARAGVTTAMTGPGSANVVGGQFALVSTHGRTINEVLIKSPVALKCAFGENPKGVYGQNKMQPHTRMGSAYLFRELFYRGQEYLAKRRLEEASEAVSSIEKSDFHFDLNLEPVADALARKLPLKIHAHRADDILTAVRLCEEFGVRYTLDHCTEGHLIVDALKEAYASDKATLEGIFLGPLFGSQTKPELGRSDSSELVPRLMEVGLPVAIITDHPVIKLDLLPVYAALTCRYGVTPDQALAAITESPARILGEADKRGRLVAGLEADVALFSGHPLAFDSNCLLTVSRGEIAWEHPDCP